MSRKDALRRIDQGIAAASGGATVSVTLAGGNPGGASNADTVDGLHASPSPQAGMLLALNSLGRFPNTVIDWAAVNHNALGSLTVGNPHTQYVNAATGGITKTGQSVALAAGVAGAGLALAAGVLSVNVGTGIRIVADAVAINTHTHQTADQGGQVDHGLGLTGLADDDHTQYVHLAPASSLRNIIAAPAADVTPLRLRGFAAQTAALWQVEDGSGNALIRVNQAGDLESAGFQSGIRGWRVDHEGTAEFQNAYIRGELHATVFVKDLIEAHAGTLGIFKSGGKLHVDFTIPAIGATATLTVTDPPGGGFLFSANDWVRIKAEHANGVYDLWGIVTAPVDNLDGTQSYTFTRRSGGTGGGTIPAGVAVADYGTSGQGYIIATADLNNAPYLDVASWAGADPFTGGNHTAHVRLGQLQGITGASEYGLWAGGTYPGLTGTRYIKAADTGLVLYGVVQRWLDSGGNIRGTVDPGAGASDYLFWLGPSSGDKRFAVTGAGTVLVGNVPAQNIAGWAHASDLTKIDGGDIHAGTITAAQMAVVNANLASDWSFEYGGRGWTLYTGSTITTFGMKTGSYALVGDGNRADNYAYADQQVPVQAGAVYYAEVWCYTGGTGSRETGLGVTWRDAARAIISAVYAKGTPSGHTRYSVLATAPNNAAFADLRLAQWGTPNLAAPRWDDVVFRAASGMNLVVGTPGSARVEINNTGIEGYDGSSVRQFRIRTSDGVGAFGPIGKESLISASGLRLWGGETTWTTFSAVRWLANSEIETSGRIGSIGAGRYHGGTAPSMQIIANPNGDYATGSLALRADSSTPNEYSVMEMRSGPPSGGTWTMSGLHSGAINWTFTAGGGQIDMSILGTQQMLVNANGLTPRALNWWGGPLNREQVLSLTGYDTGTYVWVRVRTQQTGPGERVRQFSVWRSIHQDGTNYGQLAAIVSGTVGRWWSLSGQGYLQVLKGERIAALLIEARLIEDAGSEPYSGIYLKLLGGRTYTFHGVDEVTVYGTGTPTGASATRSVPVAVNGAISMYAGNMYYKVDNIFDVEGVVRSSARFDLGAAQGVSGSFTALVSASLTPASFSFSETYRDLVTGVTGSGITVSKTGAYDWVVNAGTFSGGSLSTGSGTAGFTGGIRTS